MNKAAKTLALIALLTTSFSLTQSVYAADSYSLVVQQAELTTMAGLQKVHSRMLRAAKDYCPTYRQIRSHSDVAACIAGVVQDLTDKVADERLSNYIAALERPSTVRTIAQQSSNKTSR